MTKTIAPSYAQTCFDPEQDIKGWYNNLKELNDFAIITDIRAQYKQVIKPLSKPPKDLETWITNWEQIMAKEIDRNIPFATQPVEWFNDFLAAVAPVNPVWVRAYRLARMLEV
jgi:hypothetical protein